MMVEEQPSDPSPVEAPVKEEKMDGDEDVVRDLPAPVSNGGEKRPRLSMDENLTKRSRRMFGILNGTLQKAAKSTTRKTEAEKRREEIEQKLQEKLKKEKEELAVQVEQDFKERSAMMKAKREQEDQERIEKTKEHIKAQIRNTSHFLKTHNGRRSQIYYLPKEHNDKTTQLLLEAKRKAALNTTNESSAPATAEHTGMDVDDADNARRDRSGTQSQDGAAERMDVVGREGGDTRGEEEEGELGRD
ncbi:pinin/SDK/memA/ protein conserved region-domain-containing protein [Fimicolochytrium jonesii]|uniref:pinin/SDK/memA/ protein conserved region-domain-containing protein n=1 Tax=Fimicolochytrium jonesii TaxID=1396493 RepID=UPI0022FE08B0|nr:pinin/SDK/memA/ protein conserved region-domain-containing protein [Fimicolochytrium jonesii]KAI8819991.1 pinin/SDK/memA/ protein conserved region-domain-containing protein [Fimicolochytrium jonesii]